MCRGSVERGCPAARRAVRKRRVDNAQVGAANSVHDVPLAPGVPLATASTAHPHAVMHPPSPSSGRRSVASFGAGLAGVWPREVLADGKHRLRWTILQRRRSEAFEATARHGYGRGCGKSARCDPSDLAAHDIARRLLRMERRQASRIASNGLTRRIVKGTLRLDVSAQCRAAPLRIRRRLS
jgi:hypothetical protein